jgi:hypothetical protein
MMIGKTMTRVIDGVIVWSAIFPLSGAGHAQDKTKSDALNQLYVGGATASAAFGRAP